MLSVYDQKQRDWSIDLAMNPLWQVLSESPISQTPPYTTQHLWRSQHYRLFKVPSSSLLEILQHKKTLQPWVWNYEHLFIFVFILTSLPLSKVVMDHKNSTNFKPSTNYHLPLPSCPDLRLLLSSFLAAVIIKLFSLFRRHVGLVLSTVATQQKVPSSIETFLCGVSMFSLYLSGFTPDTLVSFQSPKTPIWVSQPGLAAL